VVADFHVGGDMSPSEEESATALVIIHGEGQLGVVTFWG